ncbi:MAG: hypothetical protein HN353_00960 [Bdellovibrionales bacterium]|jgi:hypothetical protein|nr:hypothetical protein [Bdellovibrionales bacterium]MBT3526761.1 hypothetical protein [Bdellovibrionales bacterium]MBT7670251.1 hypothetical protein [Bdellovibrionales bacterium]MBT7767330.1 hypothetical protein [Bdellovibrionales bacterium]
MRTSIYSLLLLLFVLPLWGQQNYTYDDDEYDSKNIDSIYTTSGLDLSFDVSSIINWDSSDRQIMIYNTGVELSLKHSSGLSLDLATSVDGPIGEIDSENFKVGTFIKELRANYQFENEDAAIMLSVGKMPTGTKVNRDTPKNVSGVMGIRMSLSPKKIPLIQKWLDKNDLKVTKIEITRYNSSSSDQLYLSDLQERDMTAYALHMTYQLRLHTFFIYKKPDSGSYTPEGITLGAAYSPNLPLNPHIFALAHSSQASFLDLKILVLSASVEVVAKTRLSVTWSSAEERLSNSNKNTTDFAVRRNLGELFGRPTYLKVGVKEERSNQTSESDVIYYFQVEIQ